MRENKPPASSLASTQHPVSTLQRVLDWIVEKRIAISLIAFFLLIGFNLLILRTLPIAPFDLGQTGSLLGTGLVLFGLAIRSWAAGTLHKNAEVTTVGPYAVVRNPLYVGSFLMIFGFSILMKDWLALAFALGPLAVVYWFKVLSEERNLSVSFGPAWEDYAARTGRFFPRGINVSRWHGWQWSQWVRNHEYHAVLATAVGLGALWIYAKFG